MFVVVGMVWEFCRTGSGCSVYCGCGSLSGVRLPNCSGWLWVGGGVFVSGVGISAMVDKVVVGRDSGVGKF